MLVLIVRMYLNRLKIEMRVPVPGSFKRDLVMSSRPNQSAEMYMTTNIVSTPSVNETDVREPHHCCL